MSSERKRKLIALWTAVCLCAGAAGALLSASAENPEPPLFSDGFESGDLREWTTSAGISVQDAMTADSSWAAWATMSGEPAHARKTLPRTASTATVRLRLQVTSRSRTTPVHIAKVASAAGLAIAGVFITSAGNLGLRNDVVGLSTTSAVAVPSGEWHEIIWRTSVEGSSSTSDVVLDGVLVPQLSLVHDLGDSPIGLVQIGEDASGRTAELVYDSISVSGATPPASRSTPRSPSPPASVSSPPAPGPAAPVLAAAGDIACDPLKPQFNGGLGTGSVCAMKAVSDSILADASVTNVAALGDVQYECAGLDAFNASYDPTWGRFKAKTRPAVGNHEYLATSTAPATDCDATGQASGYYAYYGALAGDPTRGYYSYDLGSWHIIVLNTQCSEVGGCAVGSPQERWLREDLAAHPAQCTLAYYHIPLWSSGGRASPNSTAFVADLVNAGAEVVLAAHDHSYERFAPMNASGTADPGGVRSFVVGTGGANHTPFVEAAPNSEAKDARTYGYLRLTLGEARYDWQFVPVGGTFTDSGSAPCH